MDATHACSEQYSSLNIKWWQHIPNSDLYGDFPKAGVKVAARRMSLVGHCIRHLELPAEKVLLWEPTHGHRRRGRQKDIFLDTLRKDAGLESTGGLRMCMEDRGVWRIGTRTQLWPP